MSKKIYLIIGITIFILIMGSYFQITNSNSKTTNNTDNNNIENKTEMGEIVYNGKFAMPIENFIQVTSKFGYRESHGVVHSNHTGIVEALVVKLWLLIMEKLHTRDGKMDMEIVLK